MEINWTDHVRNEDVLDTAEEKMNISHKIEEGRVTELVTPCVRTALQSTLLKDG